MGAVGKQRLIIMRHAKSDWAAGAGGDFDRPLSERGRKAAPRMGKWLKREKLIPDRIVASPALRALQTARMVADRLGIAESDIEQDERIYENSLAVLLEVVTAHAGGVDALMLVGHNPGLDELLCHLAAAPPPRDAEGKLLTAGAAAALDFDDGISAAAGCGRLFTLMRPKELKS
jgi:phosphohistidine phosphatase